MERGNPLKGQVLPVLGGGGVWGEEDVLDNTCVPFFHCSLPWRLILRVDRMRDPEANPSQDRDLAPPSSGPQNFSPLTTLSRTSLSSSPAVPTQLRGQGPWGDDKRWWEV